MSDIIEKMGLKPIEREYNPLLDALHFYEDNIREVEQQRNVLFKSLFSHLLFIEQAMDGMEDEFKKDFTTELLLISNIDPQHRSWEEIKELLNES